MDKHAHVIKADSEDDDNDVHPLQRPTVRSTIGRALERATNNIQFGIEEWIEETRATAQVASVSGDFDASFKFYEMLGKSIGAVQDPKAQHLHVHQGNLSQVQEMPTEELTERRAILLRQKQAQDAQDLAEAQLKDLM